MKNRPLNPDQIYKLRVILAALGLTKREVARRLGLAENYVRQELGGFSALTGPVQDGLVELLSIELFGRSRVPRRSSDSRSSTVPRKKRKAS